jgi:hypothetical protein
MGGDGYVIRAEIRDGVIYFEDFFAGCFGRDPYDLPCRVDMWGFDPPQPAALDDNCEFSLEVSEARVRIEIEGTVDPDGGSISGAYGFYYRDCCRSGGWWWATK